MKKENKNLDQVLANLVEDDEPRNNPPNPKTGEIMRRAFATELRSIDESNRRITFVASTESVDRYGDIIRVAGWKTANYKKNPVFLWAHRSNELPIGKTIDIRTEAEPAALVQTVEFATHPFAQTVFDLYKNGFMRAVSVGFAPLEEPKLLRDSGERVTGYEFTSQELLELSAVPIPANPEALARGFVSDAEAKILFARQADEEELGEQPEDEPPGSHADLAEEVSESLGEVQAALTEAVGNLAVLTAAITGQKSLRRPAKTKKTDPVDELLSTIVVADE